MVNFYFFKSFQNKKKSLTLNALFPKLFIAWPCASNLLSLLVGLKNGGHLVEADACNNNQDNFASN